MIKQQTISKQISISGVGLHSGTPTKIIFEPAPTNFGINFQRDDESSNPLIRADIDFVKDTSRGISIANDRIEIQTIEHLMSALAGLQIDNILIRLNSPEIPFIDGSAFPYVSTLLKAKIISQNENKSFLEAGQNVNYKNDKCSSEFIYTPFDKLHIIALIDYNVAVFGPQFATLEDIDKYAEEIAPCRTFCFLHELEYLLKNDLIKGVNLSNIIVFINKLISQQALDELAEHFNKSRVKVLKEGILNNLSLHFQNEPARHKILDLLGDLALLGKSIKGKIFAIRPGHRTNIEFAKQLRKESLKPMPKTTYEYDIAFSFAGEDREYVEKVATVLRSKGVYIFYDRYEQASLWGKDLYQHLTHIYRDKCRYCIIFISKFYASKIWTNIELKGAQARAMQENIEYILPVRFDKTELPGMNNTVGYLNLNKIEPSVLADIIIKKLES